jgi:predicted Zn-dependent peptidase
MNYQKITGMKYDIHIINNNRFHTTECKICFTEYANKELITYRNALVSVLTYATMKYDSKKKLIEKCQDLYSLVPIASSSRNGNLLTTKFSLTTVNSQYIVENNLIDNILMLREIVLNPLVESNAFAQKYFNIVKKELELETKTISEEPRLYANIELLKIIDENEEIVSGYSDLDILKKMDEKKLYQSYLKMLHDSKIDIFISGNINNTKDIIKVIKDNFDFNGGKNIVNAALIIHHNKKNQPIVKIEDKVYQQSKLSVGFKLYDLTKFENRYVSFVFNNLFGGGANSLLMRYVREENSLCYYINSYINRMDNIVIVNSGINKENYDLLLEMIQKVIQKIISGDFSLNDLNEAKMEILYGLSTVFESNRSIIDYYYGMSIFHSDNLDTKIKMIKKVGKDDIISFAKKLNMEGIFFLRGGYDEY